MNIKTSDITFLELEYLLDSDDIFNDDVRVYSSDSSCITYISTDYITIPSLDIDIHIAYRDTFNSEFNEYITDCSGYYIKNKSLKYFEYETYLSSALNNFFNSYYNSKNININNLKYNLTLNPV